MAKGRETKSVLVIEDEADIRRFAHRLLDLEGYQVFEAENGNEGLRMVKGARGLSLVLLDLRLPGCDGWVILDEMKHNPKLSAIPVIVFSASAAEWQRKKALGMGAAGYLVKPLDAASLKQAVAATTHWEEVMSGAVSQNGRYGG
ncbi:MAG TPA: response regulator [Dehalococcoidia bacterium]|nr:response regulator [Dehalococcoidia bacterium]